MRTFYSFWLDGKGRVVAGAHVHTHDHGHAHGHGEHEHAADDGVGSIEAIIRSRARVDARRLAAVDKALHGLTYAASRAS